ncbi:DUF6197 family protein [Catenulispora pinisilvae]|uniref:DUF6197 family protein n=1 Tax=Catenulispora pinisilvae TaxID=2705253 RepID=UPI0018921555|nr:hypothetical protein [Catenulispora pinisilvae]
MGATIVDPARLVLADAADLIETRGWDRTAHPYAPGYPTVPYAPDFTGKVSVRGALEVASRTRDWGSLGHSDAADDGVCALASYVIDTVFVAVHSVMVTDCRTCTQCREHRHQPLVLIGDQECPNGCALCDEHMDLTNPHGQHTLATEDVVDTWESYMPHQRDVISGLRAAAARPEL